MEINMQKRLKLLFMGLVAGIFLATVSNVSAAASSEPGAIRITYVKLPLNVPAVLVKHMGMLEKEFRADEIKIERPEITSGGKQTQALAAGSIDIASVVSSTSAITARANGVDLKVVAVFARAPRAFNIVAIDPGIKSVKDLKGRKVAGPKGSLLNQTLYAALIKNGLNPEDVGYVHMGVPKAMAALVGKSVDAALIAGPFVPKAESRGARIIANGDGLVKGLIVTAVRESFLEKYPVLVKRCLAVRNKALEFMKDNPEKTCEIVAQETGLSVENVRRMIPWYDFNPSIDDSDIADLKATQSFLVESGMLEEPTAIEELVKDMSE
jgi:sulfonate transport system substrate-binding protein